MKHIKILLLLLVPFLVVAQKRRPAPPPPTYIPPTSPAPKAVQLESYKLSTDKDWLAAFTKAKLEADTIRIGAGTFSINTATNGTGWYLERDNLTIIGAGIDKTILTAGPLVPSTISNQTRLVVPFVRGFAISDTAYTYTYKNTTRKGDAFLILKNKNFASTVKPGSKMMLIGGSHYFDQEFGELVTVTKKSNDTLYLKDPLSGSYSIDSVPYASITTHDFVMPAVGRTVKITTNVFYNMNAMGRLISVGDNIFSLYAIDTILQTMTLLNIGKGNATAGTVIPLGTIVARGRIIAIWNHTKNLKIQNLTIKGQQDRVLRLDNTYGAELKNVKVTRASTNAEGYNYTFDFCRDIKLVNCQLVSLNGNSGSQISRSSGDISFYKCLIDKVKTDASEWCFNVKMDSCTFNLTGANTFILGHTVRKSWITNSTFNLDSTVCLFQSGEIQNTNRVQREYALISGNTFNILNWTNTLIDLPTCGRSVFANNKINGGAMDAFSASLNRIENGNNLYPTDNRIENNTFNTTFRRWFIYGGVCSGVVNGNIIGNTGSIPLPFGTWTNLKSATVSNNQFKGFKNYMVVPEGVILLNNIIE